MTNEQINTAIAEACGWRKEDGVWMWTANHIDHTCWELWDWANDLNAMREAEKVLNQRQYLDFTMQLHKWFCNRSKPGHIWHAPARQRAEAFLRVVDKWEEVQK